MVFALAARLASAKHQLRVAVLCCAVQRDVPGLTRAVIPVFVSKGIKAISVGVNAGSAPPGVPKYTPFIWRDEASGTQILAFWHPGVGHTHSDKTWFVVMAVSTWQVTPNGRVPPILC